MVGELRSLSDHVQMMGARTARLIPLDEPGIPWRHIIPESWTPEIVVAFGFEDGSNAGVTIATFAMTSGLPTTRNAGLTPNVKRPEARHPLMEFNGFGTMQEESLVPRRGSLHCWDADGLHCRKPEAVA